MVRGPAITRIRINPKCQGEQLTERERERVDENKGTRKEKGEEKNVSQFSFSFAKFPVGGYINCLIPKDPFEYINAGKISILYAIPKHIVNCNTK